MGEGDKCDVCGGCHDDPCSGCGSAQECVGHWHDNQKPRYRCLLCEPYDLSDVDAARERLRERMEAYVNHTLRRLNHTLRRLTQVQDGLASGRIDPLLRASRLIREPGDVTDLGVDAWGGVDGVTYFGVTNAARELRLVIRRVTDGRYPPGRRDPSSIVYVPQLFTRGDNT